MQLRLTAAIAAFAGVAAMSHAQLLTSFENGLSGWSANNGFGTVTIDTFGATNGTSALRWDRPANSGWKELIVDLGVPEREILASASKKVLLVDVTHNDAGNYWRQFYPVFNSDSGGWSMGSLVAGNFAQNSTVTYALPYSGLNIPTPASPWANFFLVYQTADDAPAFSVWFDNIRLEETNPGPSFETDASALVAEGSPAEFLIESASSNATDGTKSAKVTWPGGFYWMKLSLTTEEAAALNNGTGLLLFDVDLPTRFEPSGWGNMRVGLNDNSGWRELPMQFDVPGWAGGKKTMIANLKPLLPIPLDSPWKEILLAINGPTGASKTFYMDNFRFEKKQGGAAAITGKVNVDSVGDDAGVKVKLQIRQPGTLTLAVPEVEVTLGANGEYSVPVGSLTAGTYDLWFKGKNTIAAKISNVSIGASGAAGQDVELKSGDIDNDNSVTVFDYDKLSQYFDKTSADSDWTTADGDGVAPVDADLDNDGSVTVFDYDVLSQNFDLIGAE